MNKAAKFHGMIVVADDDLESVKGKIVVEMTSAGKLVGRKYDLQGNADDDYEELDLNDVLGKPDLKEENITGSIKRTLGKNSIVISESAINHIKNIMD